MNDILKIAALIVVLFAGYKVFFKQEKLFGGGDSKSSQRAKPPAHVSKLDVIAAKEAYEKAFRKQKQLEAKRSSDEHSRVLIAKATAVTAEKQKYFNETLANYQAAGGRINFSR